MDEDSELSASLHKDVGWSEWIDSKVDAEDISNSMRKLSTQSLLLLLNNVQIPRLIQK